jgi:hypothetical protein
MKNICRFLLIALFTDLISFNTQAQYTFFTPGESFAIEVSLPNTGLKRLPIHRNSISSLIVRGDNIIGGTSAIEGLSPYIFTASLKKKQLLETLDLNEIIPGQRAIITGFCPLDNDYLFAGTLANKTSNGSAGNGHLLKLSVNGNGSISVTDLGIPIPGEGIMSLTSDPQTNSLYGVSYPSGLFFRYSIESKETKTYNDIIVTDKQIETLKEYDLMPDNYLCKSLIIADGQVFGSAPVNRIFCFNTKNESFEILKDIPEVWGRRTLGQIESWTRSGNGKIYGGNAGDGQLFELDPLTKELRNLGKPIGMNRLRGLTYGSDGKLYGIAGSKPGYTHLFSYCSKEGFTDLGNPEFEMVAPGIEQGILWRGFQLGTIASSEDGRYIIMGEDESLSQLLIFLIADKYEQRIGM